MTRTTTAPLSDITRKTIERRAVEAAIWGTPIVSVHAMREAFFRDGGADYNDILHWSKASTWKNQTTTPTGTTFYVYFNINTKNGPVVVDVPPTVEAGLFGAMLDAWQNPLIDVGPEGEDQGEGAKYLILPPDFDGDVPAGYFVAQSETYNGYALFRFTPRGHTREHAAAAVAMQKKLRVYPLAEALDPPQQRFVDMADTLFDGIMTYDETFYAALAQMIGEEPVLEQDKTMMGLLRFLGIEKGKAFEPTGEMRSILTETAKEALAFLLDGAETSVTPFWKNSTWAVPITPSAIETAMSFRYPAYLDTDGRAVQYFQVYGGAKAVGKRSGNDGVPQTFYQTAFRDADGSLLRGEERYRLRVPADVPVTLFWDLNVYDTQTCGFIREMDRVNLDSLDQEVEKNADGSVDVYFGPEAPAGKETNWVPTAPGRDWFPFFRAYGPKASLFVEKTWILPAIERVPA